MSKQQTQLLSWSQVILVSRFFVLCLSLLFFNITMKLYTAVNCTEIGCNATSAGWRLHDDSPK